MRKLLCCLILVGGCSKAPPPAPVAQEVPAARPAPVIAPSPVRPPPLVLPPDLPDELTDKSYRAEVVGIMFAMPGLGRITADDTAHLLALITGFRLVSLDADQAQHRIAGAVEMLRRYADDLEERYQRKTKRKLFDGQGRYVDLADAMHFAQQDMARHYGSKADAIRVMADDMGGRENSAGFWAVDFALVKRMTPFIAKTLDEKPTDALVAKQPARTPPFSRRPARGRTVAQRSDADIVDVSGL